MEAHIDDLIRLSEVLVEAHVDVPIRPGRVSIGLGRWSRQSKLRFGSMSQSDRVIVGDELSLARVDALIQPTDVLSSVE